VSAAAQHVYLQNFLEPLAPFLAMPGLTDLFVNRPGEVWTECLGRSIERHEVPELDHARLLRLARQIAASSAQGINRESPLLSASLPDGSRVQIVLPPATRGEVAIAIRKHAVQNLSLEAYRGAGIASQVELEEGASDVDSADMVEQLRAAVKARKNILISGGTGSGKTTLLNALLGEVPDNERLIVIEDTPELMIRHSNSVGLLATRGRTGEADVTAEDLLIASMRMRPDRIILGEIRGNEATTFLRAINTGHPGSISTIHANSAEQAIDQLAFIVLQAGASFSWGDVVNYVRRSIDLFVKIERYDVNVHIEISLAFKKDDLSN